MDINTFETIIKRYGTRPDHWPAEDRQPAVELLGRSEAARAIVAAHQPLDDALTRYSVDVDVKRLEQRILEQVERMRRSRVDRLVRWLWPDPAEPASIWRPALAAAVPLVFGVIIGSSATTLTLDGSVQYPVEEELYMMGLASETEENDLLESLP